MYKGFSEGFSIEYRGPEERRDTARNIPFSVGDKFILWEKMMKEVKLRRFAGPFKDIPFKYFIQSPVGLVPKAGGQTSLIFHLSYNFSQALALGGSVNHFTPQELCSIKYRDLDHAVRNCLVVWQSIRNNKGQDSEAIFLAKSDLLSAFRNLPLKISDRKYLIMMAKHPLTEESFYFIEKNLLFGHSISCSHFQRFSNSLHHLMQCMTGKKFSITNYLDDFLFLEVGKAKCNKLVRKFLTICKRVGFPVSMEKTEWASTKVIFLGILIDGKNKLLLLPEDKRLQSINLICEITSKRTVKIKKLEKLAGHLNFLCKAVFPGRVFIRRMYLKFTNLTNKSGRQLKDFHHVAVDAEFKADCAVWLSFLNNVQAVARPWVGLSLKVQAKGIHFYTDASLNENYGIGCIFQRKFWMFAKWEKNFIKHKKPSIEYAELLGLCVGVLTWQYRIQNTRVVLYTDNETVMNMVNNNLASCKNCMVLLRILTLNNLKFNRRTFAKHVAGKKNFLSDALSRQKNKLV